MEGAQIVQYKGESIDSKEQIAKFLRQVEGPKERYELQCELREKLWQSRDKNGELLLFLYEKTLKDNS